jgi:hypothetical protein
LLYHRTAAWHFGARRREGKRVIRIDKEALSPSATVASFLDDQWAPVGWLKSARFRGGPRNRDRMREAVQAEELKHALLTSREVIVNRSYFSSNQIMIRFARAARRQALVEALQEGALIPFLSVERSLGDELPFRNDPDAVANAKQAFYAAPDAKALRLSWADAQDDNEREVRKGLHDPFTAFLKRLPLLDHAAILRAFGMFSEAALASFTSCATRAAGLANQQDTVLRWQLYQHLFGFIPKSISETLSLDDGQRCFKELVDLRYNVNLSDAVDRYASLGAGVIGRGALGDDPAMAAGVAHAGTADLLTLFSNFVDATSRPADRAWLPLGRLSWSAINRIRRQPEWLHYMEVVEEQLPRDRQSLSASPLLRPQAFERYRAARDNLRECAMGVAEIGRKADAAQFMVSLSIEVVGSLVKARLGFDPNMKLSEDGFDTALAVLTRQPGIALVSRVEEYFDRRGRRRARTEPLAKLRFDDPREEMATFVEQLRRAFKPVRTHSGATSQDGQGRQHKDGDQP